MPALLRITSPAERAKAIQWCRVAQWGSRVEFRGPQRSTDQNSLMWVLLTAVSDQREHFGRKYKPDQWKMIFMSALGREMEFVPTLDGTSFLPIGHRSSKLSKAEMSELIEFILAWGAEHGVDFGDAPAEARKHAGRAA